jgi:uncharacterized protein (DUF169 family)
MDTKTFTRELETHVRPATFPLAIRMLRPGEEPPPKARRPARDLRVQVAVCQAVSIGRRYGWTVAVGRDDIHCVLTKVAFGFEPELPYYTEGNCACGMYTETLAAGARTEAATDKFPRGEYETIVIAPAARADFAPHLVLVYGNAAQVMRMVTAALWKRGGALHASFTGRLDCSDAIIRTMLRDDYQVLLPCYGDRVFGQTEDHEMAFTIPAASMDHFVEGLNGTHRGGVRYPIPTFLRYRPEFPESYNKLEELWAREESVKER